MKSLQMFLTAVFLWCGVCVVFAAGGPPPQKKVAVVFSYARGYPWNDELEGALMQGLATAVQTREYFLESRNRASDAVAIKNRAARIRSEIDAWKPDLIISCDDVAMQYLIVPFYRGTSIPVVHCGINASDAEYHLPPEQITGMVETQFVDKLVSFLAMGKKEPRIGYIGPDTETARKIAEYVKQRYPGRVTAIYSVDAEHFRADYIELQKKVDLIVFNGCLFDFDHDEAVHFLMENTRIPTGANYAFIAPYVMLSFAVNPNEFGTWTVRTALRILNGTPVKEIPRTENKSVRIFINLPLANQAGMVFPFSILKNACVIDQKMLYQEKEWRYRLE